MTAKFEIKGMHCASCSAIVEKTMSELEGVKTASVSLLLNTAEVEYDENIISPKQIAKAVKAAGFPTSVKKK
ncbi:MAG: heavy-metal-associated domain-containing protein [Clostridia bacterium]|nr:heavy-metal-associated domain-containing protein [Clostridia bacterium]